VDDDMDLYITSCLSGLIGALITALGSFIVLHIKSKGQIKEAKFQLYMTLRQIQYDIDEAYKRLVNDDPFMISPLFVYDGTYNYVNALCTLKEKLTDDEISVINRFFEDVKEFDVVRMSVNNTLQMLNSDTAHINPAFTMGTQTNYNMLMSKYRGQLERFKQDNYYGGKLVLIIDKLKK